MDIHRAALGEIRNTPKGLVIGDGNVENWMVEDLPQDSFLPGVHSSKVDALVSMCRDMGQARLVTHNSNPAAPDFRQQLTVDLEKNQIQLSTFRDDVRHDVTVGLDGASGVPDLSTLVETLHYEDAAAPAPSAPPVSSGGAAPTAAQAQAAAVDVNAPKASRTPAAPLASTTPATPTAAAMPASSVAPAPVPAASVPAAASGQDPTSPAPAAPAAPNGGGLAPIPIPASAAQIPDPNDLPDPFGVEQPPVASTPAGANTPMAPGPVPPNRSGFPTGGTVPTSPSSPVVSPPVSPLPPVVISGNPGYPGQPGYPGFPGQPEQPQTNEPQAQGPEPLDPNGLSHAPTIKDYADGLNQIAMDQLCEGVRNGITGDEAPRLVAILDWIKSQLEMLYREATQAKSKEYQDYVHKIWADVVGARQTMEAMHWNALVCARNGAILKARATIECSQMMQSYLGRKPNLSVTPYYPKLPQGQGGGMGMGGMGGGGWQGGGGGGGVPPASSATSTSTTPATMDPSIVGSMVTGYQPSFGYGFPAYMPTYNGWNGLPNMYPGGYPAGYMPSGYPGGYPGYGGYGYPGMYPNGIAPMPQTIPTSIAGIMPTVPMTAANPAGVPGFIPTPVAPTSALPRR
jgi:hypothetical protein